MSPLQSHQQQQQQLSLPLPLPLPLPSTTRLANNNINHAKTTGIPSSHSVNNIQSFSNQYSFALNNNMQADISLTTANPYLLDAFNSMSLYGDFFSSQQQQQQQQLLNLVRHSPTMPTSVSSSAAFDEIGSGADRLADDFIALEQTDALTASFDWLKSIIDDSNNNNNNNNTNGTLGKTSVPSRDARDGGICAEEESSSSSSSTWLSNGCSSFD